MYWTYECVCFPILQSVTASVTFFFLKRCKLARVYMCVWVNFVYLDLKDFFFLFSSIMIDKITLFAMQLLPLLPSVCLYNKNISNVNCFFFSFHFSVYLVYNQMYIVFFLFFSSYRLAHQMIEKCLHTGFKFLYLNRLLNPLWDFIISRIFFKHFF